MQGEEGFQLQSASPCLLFRNISVDNLQSPEFPWTEDLWNEQPTSLNLYFWKIWLTNFHKIDIFQSTIHRVAAQISLRFQGKKPKSEGNLREISAKSRISVNFDS